MSKSSQLVFPKKAFWSRFKGHCTKSWQIAAVSEGNERLCPGPAGEDQRSLHLPSAPAPEPANIHKEAKGIMFAQLLKPLNDI